MGKIEGNETLEQGIRTMLDFRDVSKELEEGTLEFLRQYDVVRRIKIGKAELSKKGKGEVYKFNAQNYQNMSGIVFPYDEIVEVGQTRDIIIEKPINAHLLYVHAQIYHDLYKRETILVKITRRGEKGDPSFKLFNGITGYIRSSRDYKHNKQIGIGTKLFVEVEEFNKIGQSGILQVIASENFKNVI